MLNEYFASVDFRHREQEMIRDLERRRVRAERSCDQLDSSASHRGFRVTVAAWIGRLHSPHRQQTARG